MTDTHPGRKALDKIMAIKGVTPGPWYFEKGDEWFQTCVTGASNTIASEFSVDSDAYYTTATNPSALGLIAAYVAALEAEGDAAHAAGRKAGIEEAALLVEQNEILHGPGADELRPRIPGNKNGMAYVNAIRALAQGE